jgi:hypothetical protein
MRKRKQKKRGKRRSRKKERKRRKLRITTLMGDLTIAPLFLPFDFTHHGPI